ncbi:magnesium transporter MgtE [Iodidimonas gelatinilytica]|uniref:Magnesium transporter MgtE n=1 Tax=Iodidimonas gelatinilytica TaxID=1236966 RepID=A0A5A7MSB3_9PROT|nr:magnesium transporter [Iodidimonas gelatinilytica]GEQ98831.1 magnesium transporter MgtE [Iodidimonas gelatinilytica]
MTTPEDRDDLTTSDRASSTPEDNTQGPSPDAGQQDPNYGMDIHLQPDFVRAIVDAIHADDTDTARALVADLHVADIADLFEVLSSEERRSLARLVADALDPNFLSELEGAAFDDVVKVISPSIIADAVKQLDTDDAVYILEDLNAESQQEVLHALTREDRTALEEGLAFPEDSAGRLMQRHLVAVPEFWSIGQTIDFLRAQEDDQSPNDFYELIVVDPAYRPIGTVPLSRVLSCKRPMRIKDVMNPDPHIMHVTTDQEEVARQFAKYHLISAGVVNDYGRLVGVITVDDIVGVIEDEAQEDILALAGVSEGDVNVSIRDVSRTRFIWLFVNMGTAVLASLVIGLFDATLEAMVALAVLMPIVASMGGNAGTQTMAVAVRALATKELSPANAMRIVNKELIVALINGVGLAIVVGIVGMIWFGDILLSLVLATAMIINMVVAGLSGIMVPMILDRFGVDPAVASSVFVTTITDVVGFFAFLGLAALVLV